MPAHAMLYLSCSDLSSRGGQGVVRIRGWGKSWPVGSRRLLLTTGGNVVFLITDGSGGLTGSTGRMYQMDKKVREHSASMEKMKLYLKKRERRELLVQHMRQLFSNMLREVRLAKPGDFITFGSCIQLQAPDMPGFMPRSSYRNYGVAMAGTIHERDIDKAQKFTDGCAVVCSPALTPCVRNTFVIKSADCQNKNGQNLLFGQEFLLQVIESADEPLYIRAEPPLVDGPHGPMGHNPVRLSFKNDCYSKWRVIYWDSNMRFETEGAPFPGSTRVVISQLMTGQCLAVEYSEWYTTVFGMECGISVHTYADVHGRETAECLWMFVTEKVSKEEVDKCA